MWRFPWRLRSKTLWQNPKLKAMLDLLGPRSSSRLLVWTAICCSCCCTDVLKESAAPAALRLEAGSSKPILQKLQELMRWSASVPSTPSSSPYVLPCCICFLFSSFSLSLHHFPLSPSPFSFLIFLHPSCPVSYISTLLCMHPWSQGLHLNSNITNWLYKVIIVEHLFIRPLILVHFNSWFFAIIPSLYWVFCSLTVKQWPSS